MGGEVRGASPRVDLADDAATEALQNARDLHYDAQVLAEAGRYARAFALECVAIEEVSKTFLWRLIGCGILVKRSRNRGSSLRGLWHEDGNFYVDSRALNDHGIKDAVLVSSIVAAGYTMAVADWKDAADAGRVDGVGLGETINAALQGDPPESEAGELATRLVRIAAAEERLETWKKNLEPFRRHSLYVDIEGDQLWAPRAAGLSQYEQVRGLAEISLETLGRLLEVPMPDSFVGEVRAIKSFDTTDLPSTLTSLWCRWIRDEIRKLPDDELREKHASDPPTSEEGDLP